MSSTPQQSQGISIADLRSDLNGEVIGPDDAALTRRARSSSRRRPPAGRGGAGRRRGRCRSRRHICPRERPRAGRAQRRPQPRGLRDQRRRDRHRPLWHARSRHRRRPETASVQTGVTAGEYTSAVGERGRATGLGDTGSVGIGGITLAGGIGFLVRKYGLTIDDLLAAEVVTADGEIVQTSEESEPDLFWAIRGGGGNFGVVTRLQLRLHEISEIVGGMVILPATPEVITGFIEAAEAAPEGSRRSPT